MKLFYSPASPYARKCVAVAHQTGQTLDVVQMAASPVNRNAEIVARNPTGKIPTLVLADGTSLYDSRVICRYLDARHGGPKMYPEGDALWTVLRREALADGLLDAALLARYETAMRPAEKLWPEWLAGQMAKIDSSLDVMEAEAPSFDGVDAGLIAVGSALGYLDFRFADHDWRGARPALAAWFATFSAVPCMAETAPA